MPSATPRPGRRRRRCSASSAASCRPNIPGDVDPGIRLIGVDTLEEALERLADVGHHRRAHRRHRRDGCPRQHARGPAVRAGRAAGHRRLAGPPQAQPRPARAGHAQAAAGLPERHVQIRDVLTASSEAPRSTQARRARQAHRRRDRDQRLQPQQDRPAPGRGRHQHQRPGQRAEAGRAAGRGDAGRPDHQGRQGSPARASATSTTARWSWSTRASARSARTIERHGDERAADRRRAR